MELYQRMHFFPDYKCNSDDIIKYMKKIFLLIVCMPFLTFAQSSWYDTNWQYRIKLTTNPLQVGDAITDYPAYVDLSLLGSDFFAHVDNDGDDIVITADDGVTKLSRDLVSIDTTLETGQLHTKIPSVALATGTEFFIYYGNPGATEVNTNNATWQNYRGVWHLEETSASSIFGLGIAGQLAMDGGDGSWVNFYGPNPISTDVDLVADEDQVGDAERAHTTEEAAYWVFKTDSAFDIRNVGNKIIGEVGKVSLVDESTTSVSLRNTYTDPVVVATPNLDSDSDNPTVVRITNVTGSGFDVYLQNPSGNAVTDADVFYTVIESGLHSLPGGTPLEAGTITSKTEINHSGNWSNPEMNQLSLVGTFAEPVVMGQIMTNNDTDWQVFWTSDGTQTNKPTQAKMYIGRHTGGDSDTARDAETLGYIIVDSGSGTTNSVDWIADVTPDTVAGTDNSPPFSYALSSTANSGIFKDSTINGYDGGLSGGVVTGSNGVLGQAITLDGSVGTYIPFEGINYSGSNSLDELTASFWINTTQTARSGILDFDRSEHWSVGLNFHNASGGAGQISFDTANDANGIRDLNSGTLINDGTWKYITAVFDANAIADKSIYIDGVLAIGLDQHTAGLGKSTTRFGFLGDGSEAGSYDAGRNNLPQAGLFDEIRISNQAQSAGEVLTHYNNHSDVATFYTVGLEEENNQAPTVPTDLFANHTTAQIGLDNPSNLALYTDVIFSALYQDPDNTDQSDAARIQVSTDSTFATVTHWDSGTSTVADIDAGNRSSDITYGSLGSAALLPLAMNDGNVQYYWRILFVDDEGESSPWSNTGTFSLLDIPQAPTALSVLKTASDEFSLSWADNSNNEEQFVLEWRKDDGTGFTAWEIVATTTENINSFDDTVPLNEAFQYRVSAANYAGTSTVTIDPTIHYSDPAAPIEVFGQYNATTSSFDVNWTDQSLVVLTDRIDKCQGTADCLAETYAQIAGVLVNSTASPFNDAVVIVDDEIYRWRIRADNGATATSTYTYSPYEYTEPTAPSTVTAEYVTDTTMIINWVDNSEHEDGFRILVSQDGGTFTEVTPGVNTTASGITSYVYTGATAGSTYQFVVQAHVPETTYNTELFSSATSSVVQTTPANPDNITVNYNGTNLELTWSDNSDNEDMFIIDVSIDGGAFTQLATTTTDTELFVINPTLDDSKYQFTVRAISLAALPENPIDLVSTTVMSDEFFTKPNAPVLSAGNIGTTDIAWDVTDNADYEIGFELFEADETTSVFDVPLSNVTNFTETLLSPNTQIQRVLKSYVENDAVRLYSSSSALIDTYTAANTPVIASTTIMQVTDDSIEWKWDAQSNPAVTEYFATNLTTGIDFGWSTDTTWNESSLSCENSYDFEVRARNQLGIETGVATSTQSTRTCDISVNIPVENQTVSSSTVVSGLCSTGAEVLIQGSGMSPASTTAICVGGQFVIPVSFASSTVGVTDLSVQQTQAPFVTSNIIDLSVIVDPSSGVDSDADTISDALEDAGFNDGDGNGDGILDSLQTQVTGIPNTVTGEYTTIEIQGGCSLISAASTVDESNLSSQDSDYVYPVGLINYELSCDAPGSISTVSLYYAQEYTNDSQWILRKYASSTDTFSTLSQITTVTPANESIGSFVFGSGVETGNVVSKISFDIQDGDALDDDIAANATIIDPVGPALVVSSTNNLSGGGGTRYYCRDENASNYTTKKGKKDNGLCKYETEIEEEQNNTVQDLLNELNGIQIIGSCSPLLSTNMSRNIITDSDDVKDLQKFLNDTEGENLTVDGRYDDEDYEAVKRFQNKYRTSVLDVWGLSEATGYVGRTTRLKVNALNCAATVELTCPAFTQYNSRNNPNNGVEVGRLQQLLSDLEFYTGSINNQYDNNTISAVINFQETFSATMLKPWNLTKGTGYKYKTTNKFLNELYGCSTEDLVLENGATVSY